jgi:hypothetical protein
MWKPLVHARGFIVKVNLVGYVCLLSYITSIRGRDE